MAKVTSLPTHPETGKRMAGYVRVSTQMQVERGESLEVQEQRLESEAKRRGWELVIYKELGVSAKDSARPAYQRMREDLKDGVVNGVVATKLDRLWRNLALAVVEVEFITKQCDADLVVLDQHFDTTTAVGRAMLNTVLTFGQFEREMTAERVAEGMKARALAGKFNGGPVPYGYRLVGEQLVIDESEAATVRVMYELFLSKRIIRQVRLTLDTSGSRTRKGSRWAGNTIRRILSSSIYKGELLYNRRDVSTGKAKARSPEEHIRVPGGVPAIISPEVFAQVQAILTKPPRLAGRAQASDYLLSGIVKCKKCNASMYGHTSWQRKRAPVAKKGEPKWQASIKKSVKRIHEKYYVREALRYYRCCTLNNKGPDVCPGNSIRADALETAVQDALFDLRLKPERLRELETKEISQRRGEVPRLRTEVTRLERQLSELDAREQRVMKAYESGAYSAKDMQRRRAAIRTEREQQEPALDAARTGLSEAERDVVDVERMVEALATAYDVYESLGLEERRTLLRDLIDRVETDRAGGTIVLRTTFAGIAEELFEAGTVEKQFVVGGSTRVPWKPLKDIRLEERGSTLVRGQMVRVVAPIYHRFRSDKRRRGRPRAWCRAHLMKDLAYLSPMDRFP